MAMNYVAYDAGYDAYWEGVDFDGNPYNPHEQHQAFLAWQQGWRKARQHDYDENDG